LCFISSKQHPLHCYKSKNTYVILNKIIFIRTVEYCTKIHIYCWCHCMCLHLFTITNSLLCHFRMYMHSICCTHILYVIHKLYCFQFDRYWMLDMFRTAVRLVRPSRCHSQKRKRDTPNVPFIVKTFQDVLLLTVFLLNKKKKIHQNSYYQTTAPSRKHVDRFTLPFRRSRINEFT